MEKWVLSSISIGDCTLPFSVVCTCLHYQDPVKTVTSDTFDSVVINNQKAGPSALILKIQGLFDHHFD